MNYTSSSPPSILLLDRAGHVVDMYRTDAFPTNCFSLPAMRRSNRYFKNFEFPNPKFRVTKLKISSLQTQNSEFANSKQENERHLPALSVPGVGLSLFQVSVTRGSAVEPEALHAF